MTSTTNAGARSGGVSADKFDKTVVSEILGSLFTETHPARSIAVEWLGCDGAKLDDATDDQIEKLLGDLFQAGHIEYSDLEAATRPPAEANPQPAGDLAPAGHSAPVAGVSNANLAAAKALFDAGLKLCALHPESKRPVGDGWNKPENCVQVFDEKLSGYGLPLAINGRCSIDPDDLEMSKIVFGAWGFDYEEVMGAGVRTVSTRPGSGGRSQFKAAADLRWIKFRVKLSGKNHTVLELRAGSPNLQDVIPGLLYRDGDGNLCTQSYANGRTFLDVPDMPERLRVFWERMGDLTFRKEQELKATEALAAAGYPVDVIHDFSGISGVKAALPFDITPHIRAACNEMFEVPHVLERHGYTEHGRGRWSSPGSTGEPGIRLIPKTESLWRSDHGSDPLNGTFDAAAAILVLDFAYNTGAFEDWVRQNKVRVDFGGAPILPLPGGGIGESLGQGAVVAAEMEQPTESMGDILARARTIVTGCIAELGPDNRNGWREEKVVKALAFIVRHGDFAEGDLHIAEIGRLGGRVKAEVKSAVQAVITRWRLKEQARMICDTGQWFSPYVWVVGRGEFYSNTSGVFLDSRKMDITHMAHAEGWIDGEGHPLSATAVLQKSVCVPAVHHVMYLPDNAPGRFTLGRADYWNTFDPTSVPGAKAPAEWSEEEATAVALWDHHIKALAGNAAGHLLQWMAHNRRYPGRKITWAPLLIGTEGDGKTAIGVMLGATLGSDNVRSVSNEQIRAEFNDWAWGRALALLEEVKAEGHSRFDVWNKLKAPITNSTVSINPKGHTTYDILNTQNYFLTSNHEDALPITRTDRRLLVIHSKVPATIRGNHDYFKNLFDSLKHVEALAGWLESIDLTGFEHNGVAPWTDDKDDSIEDSRGTDEDWLVDALRDKEVVSITALSNKFKQVFGTFPSQPMLNRARKAARMEKWRGAEGGRLKLMGAVHRIWVSVKSGLHSAEPEFIRDKFGVASFDDVAGS